MARYELVVFDVDGTLVETRLAVSTTVNAALHAHGHARVEPAVIHALMGLPLQTLFTRMLPPFRRHEDVSGLVDWYRDHFDGLGLPSTSARPDVHATLAALQSGGVRLALATSRARASLDVLLPHCGVHAPWEAVMTGDEVQQGKPHPEMLERVLAQTGVAPERAIMVGDTTFDMGMACAAGVRAVGVLGGCHGREALLGAGAVDILDDLHGLSALLVA